MQPLGDHWTIWIGPIWCGNPCENMWARITQAACCSGSRFRQNLCTLLLKLYSENIDFLWCSSWEQTWSGLQFYTWLKLAEISSQLSANPTQALTISILSTWATYRSFNWRSRNNIFAGENSSFCFVMTIPRDFQAIYYCMMDGQCFLAQGTQVSVGEGYLTTRKVH